MRQFKIYSAITGTQLADGVQFDDTTCAIHFRALELAIAGPKGGVAALMGQPEFSKFELEWVR